MEFSPTQSTMRSPQPSLETLVGYMLTAKRSLSTVDTVSRANELVTTTKSVFVQQTALVARTSYLSSGCIALYSHLQQMHSQLNSIAAECGAEFDQVFAKVSAAEKKLHATLDGLKNTIVDSKLRPQDEDQKSLFDFVDREGAQGLLDDVYDNVAEVDKARRHYSGVVDKLGVELRGIKRALTEAQRSSQRAPEKGEIIARDSLAVGHGPSPVPTLLETMEASAHDMAENLESLVKHYDLCLDVLRHTEGAGAAFNQAASRNNLPPDQNAAIAQELGHADPLAEETDFPAVGSDERMHLMEMLSSDAAQVEDVVSEIHNASAALDSAIEQVQAYGAALNERYQKMRNIYESLEATEQRLPHYSTESHLHVMKLDSVKAIILDKETGLIELAEFYAGFLGAYDRLIIEVGRRKDVARRMQRLRDEATALLDQLYLDDQEERDLFRQNHGGFIPGDIWPGLATAPPRYEVVLTEGHGSVPDISASVIQRAIRRVSSKPPSQVPLDTARKTSPTTAATSMTTATTPTMPSTPK